MAPNAVIAHAVSWRGRSLTAVVRIGAAVAYAFGLGGLVRLDHKDRMPAVRFGAALLLVGVAGLSADAFVHFATAEIFLALFFMGHVGVVFGMNNGTRPSQLGVAALLLTPIASIVGWVVSDLNWMPRPIAGLAILGVLTGSLGFASVGYFLSPPGGCSEVLHQDEL